MRAANVTIDQVREALQAAHVGVAGHAGHAATLDAGLAETIVGGARETFLQALHTDALISGTTVPLLAMIAIVLLMRRDAG